MRTTSTARARAYDELTPGIDLRIKAMPSTTQHASPVAMDDGEHEHDRGEKTIHGGREPRPPPTLLAWPTSDRGVGARPRSDQRRSRHGEDPADVEPALSQGRTRKPLLPRASAIASARDTSRDRDRGDGEESADDEHTSSREMKKTFPWALAPPIRVEIEIEIVVTATANTPPIG